MTFIETNAYFTVNEPGTIPVKVGLVPTNTYYGSSQVLRDKVAQQEVFPGDEVHVLHGGIFLVSPVSHGPLVETYKTREVSGLVTYGPYVGRSDAPLREWLDLHDCEPISKDLAYPVEAYR